ncbi:lipid-A-disaccharide synthase [Paenirhodobacter enshiensis]|uniref:Lipid-A-disaccharide synthase n=1 Tax=Paenirhodobacter enshiensis TaxID=1105367 RepID=A0A086XWN4_9RHOB|nr:lipid-A-disaccharide synthase [Paenirhodobacter enshiensis]KFI26434.1 lipid-A-disaccharide synthase [Paenirhodobacter enshiensis]
MKVFLIAGEASGDKLGAALMAGLKSLVPGVGFAGVGGPLMQAEGLTSLFPMEDLSVMGLAEILPKYPLLRRRVQEAADAAIATGPDVLITIDSPDFCLRVARKVKDARPDLFCTHYVAPSVWAWRAGRAKRMAQVIDHVLALLPFEPPYMRAAGMSCDFVGHPVVSEPRATGAEAAAWRARAGIAAEEKLLLVLPGSRRGEVSRLAPKFGETLGLLKDRVAGLRVVLPTVRGVSDMVRAAVADWPVPALIVEDRSDRLAAFAAADAALAASGTVSLELAANRVPMVIGYDANRLTWAIVWRMMKIDTVTLVNLVSETRAVPEFLGPACQPEAMADAVVALFGDAGARAAQMQAMEITMTRLGEGGEAPGLRAARSVLRALSGGA